MIFSTAHKAKGLEFNTVRLTDDYYVMKPGESVENQQSDDESNLLYVAVTRAKRRLIITSTVLGLFKSVGVSIGNFLVMQFTSKNVIKKMYMYMYVFTVQMSLWNQ